MKLSPISIHDTYKSVHHLMYPEGTELVYSNMTPRKSRIPNVDYMVFFGLQAFIKSYLIDSFRDDFFNQPRDKVLQEHKRLMSAHLGQDYDVTRFGDLWDLGFLPIEIKALPEGSIVPIGVPCLTIVNTNKKFYWLTNYLETVLSLNTWHPCVAATVTHHMRSIVNKYCNETNPEGIEFTKFQLHNFCLRGCSGVESGCMVDGGHLLSSCGSDSIPGILWLEHYYNADATKELISTSIAASEHACTCVSTSFEGEFNFFNRLITEVFPSGLLSLVSDSFDLWSVLTEYLPKLKETILNRDGKIVIRPDSGDPIKIITGDPNGKTEAERKGVIECLWDVFGGTISSTGYKVLNPKIGCIQGDAVNIERLICICENLKKKGFASTNMAFGVGSFSLVMVTRDQSGLAVKATYCEIENKGYDIYKDPVTDTDKLKKSAKGLLQVKKVDGKYTLKDQCTWAEEKDSELKTVFKNGQLLQETSLREIRARVEENLNV